MIQLTTVAADKIKRLLEQRGGGLGIFVGVRTTGCSGLSYVLEYVDTVRPGQVIHESNQVKVVTNNEHLIYLDELLIDWKHHGLKQGFEFLNPREQARCGCGESFTV